MNGFSDVHCECGCGNLLLRSIADRGWKFIRGHKPKPIGLVHGGRGLANKPRAPRMRPALTINSATILLFLEAQIALYTAQASDAAAEAERARQRWSACSNVQELCEGRLANLKAAWERIRACVDEVQEKAATA